MGIPTLPRTWIDGDTAFAPEMNANFTTIRDYVNANMVELTGAQTIAGVKTFSSQPVFSAGISAAGQTIGALSFTATEATVDTRLRSVDASSAGQVGTFSAHPLWFVAGGTQWWQLTTSGHFLAITDNQKDIGASGATRPRRVYVGTEVLSPTATVTTLSAGTITGSPTLDGQAAYERVSGGNSGATPAIDWANGNWQTWTLTANATPTFANPKKGAQYVLEFLQDATGSRTVTWSGATVVWPADQGAPVLTTTASRKDLIGLFCVDATGAGVYLGSFIGANYNNTAT